MLNGSYSKYFLRVASVKYCRVPEGDQIMSGDWFPPCNFRMKTCSIFVPPAFDQQETSLHPIFDKKSSIHSWKRPEHTKECLDNGFGLSHSILCLPLRQVIHHHNLANEPQGSHTVTNPAFQHAQNEPLHFKPVGNNPSETSWPVGGCLDNTERHST